MLDWTRPQELPRVLIKQGSSTERSSMKLFGGMNRTQGRGSNCKQVSPVRSSMEVAAVIKTKKTVAVEGIYTRGSKEWNLPAGIGVQQQTLHKFTSCHRQQRNVGEEKGTTNRECSVERIRKRIVQVGCVTYHHDTRGGNRGKVL